MKINALVITIILVFISGCVTSPQKAYQSLNSVSTVAKYGEESVILNATAIPLPATIDGISFNRPSFHIAAEDPVINFGDYKSNYKLFKFEVNEGEQFRISIVSICNCLGFKKFMLVPSVYIVDEKGAILESEIVTSNSSASSIMLALQALAPHDGEYYLVLAANNSNPGESVAIGQAMAGGYIPTGIFISTSSHPYGKVIPSYKLISP